MVVEGLIYHNCSHLTQLQPSVYLKDSRWRLLAAMLALGRYLLAARTSHFTFIKSRELYIIVYPFVRKHHTNMLSFPVIRAKNGLHSRIIHALRY